MYKSRFLLSCLAVVASATASAAALSLSSTNDYIYTVLPSNANLLAFGVGPSGDGRIPRREDWYFLAEAFRERATLSQWLCATEPSTNAVPDKSRYYGANHPAALTIPNSLQIPLWLSGEEVEVLGFPFETFHTAIYDASLVSSPVELSQGLQISQGHILATNAWASMFSPGEVWRSDRASETLIESGFLAGRPLTLSTLTNLYADIVDNTAICYAQEVRATDAQDYANTTSTRYYDWPQRWTGGGWEYLTNTDVTVTNSWPTPYGVPYVYYGRSVSGYKGEFAAVATNGAPAALSAQYIVANAPLSEADQPCIIFSTPLGGASIEELAAFAVFSGTHSKRLYIQGSPVTNLVAETVRYLWPLAAPVRDGDDPAGCPVYRIALPDLRSVYQTIAAAKGIDINPLDILGEVPAPAPPAAPSSPYIYAQAVNHVYHSLTIYLDGIVGPARMEYHARLLPAE
jgi:hypothetical protein